MIVLDHLIIHTIQESYVKHIEDNLKLYACNVKQ